MHRRPRIAIASSGLGHVARGIEAWAQDLAEALAARGEDVLLLQGAGEPSVAFAQVVQCWPRESPQARRVLKALPRWLGWRLGLGSGYGVEQATFAWNLLWLLRREQIDILHVQDPYVALWVERASRQGLVRARTILAHGTEESPEFLHEFRYVQHLAPWHLEEARAAGVWKPTWTAIGNFIDTQRFSPGRDDALRRELQIPPEALVIATSAAIKRHHKRIDYLLREFAALVQRRPDLPLYLVVAGGRESDTDELVAEGNRLLGQRVRFLVRFPRARMSGLYRAADVLVLASLKEMMPIALLEATASGLACVVNDHPVLRWMTGPGALAADLSREGALAEQLERLAADAELRVRLGALARAHCEMNFSREAVVDRIVAYYQSVLTPEAPAVLAAET